MMAFTADDVSGFIRDSTGKLQVARTYVDAIKLEKTAVLVPPQDDPAFQDPISAKRLADLNSKISELFVEVSNLLAKVAAGIQDGIQPMTADVVAGTIDLGGGGVKG